MTTIRRRKVVPLDTSCGPTLPAELCSMSGPTLGTQVDLIETKQGILLRLAAKKNKLSLQERIAKTGVVSVRSHGRAFRDFPTAGREID